jgi:hypothetical protein
MNSSKSTAKSKKLDLVLLYARLLYTVATIDSPGRKREASLVEFVANVLEMLGRNRDANVYGSLRLSWLIAINGWIEFG